MKKKIVVFFAVTLIFLLILFLARFAIMRSFANFLIVENELSYTEYGFVLSGGAFDRGNKAAFLFSEGMIGQFICTGANQSPDLKAFGTDTLESDLTKLQMVKMGVPDSLVSLLRAGTSTIEESDLIMQFAKENQLGQLVVISSKFHTRRIHQVFTDKFEKEGIEVIIQGAPSSRYDELRWWESEYGLIALNNEYLKQLYYFVKY